LVEVAVLGVADQDVARLIKPGDQVQVDNSGFLAMETYHRHQVPDLSYKVWDQFRKPDGTPLYPQRRMLLGPRFVAATGGSVETGKWTGKMIMLESLWDREALPWQADWYRGQVRSYQGAKTDQNFRVWYTDHAVHGDFDPKSMNEDPNRIVSYVPVLQQALRDLSDWVEKGIAPPASTGYSVVDGQVRIAATAAARRGVQPVVTLLADGRDRADIGAGQPVRFSGTIVVPPGAGTITAADWDFDGSGAFAQNTPVAPGLRSATVTMTHRFGAPGTYFVALRGTSQRRGDRATPYTQIRNLGRVRVVVH